MSVAFSPNGTRVLSGSLNKPDDKKSVKLWDAATGQLVRAFDAPGGVAP